MQHYTCLLLFIYFSFFLTPSLLILPSSFHYQSTQRKPGCWIPMLTRNIPLESQNVLEPFDSASSVCFPIRSCRNQSFMDADEVAPYSSTTPRGAMLETGGWCKIQKEKQHECLWRAVASALLSIFSFINILPQALTGISSGWCCHWILEWGNVVTSHCWESWVPSDLVQVGIIQRFIWEFTILF